jgi:hypothetical protein
MGKASFGGERARKMPQPAGKIKTFYFKEISQNATVCPSGDEAG